MDKWISRAYLIKKPLCNEYLLAYQTTCSLLAGLVVILDLDQAPTPINGDIDLWALSILILSSIFSWMGFAYSTFRARTSNELSVVSIISKTKLVWSALFGVVFFNESLTFLQLLGGILIVFASMYVGKNNNVNVLFSNNLHAWLAPIFLTIAIGIDKMLTLYFPTSLVICLGFSGTALLTPLLFNIHYKQIKTVVINAAITATFGTISYYLLLKVLNTSALSLVIALCQGSFILDIICF